MTTEKELQRSFQEEKRLAINIGSGAGSPNRRVKRVHSQISGEIIDHNVQKYDVKWLGRRNRRLSSFLEADDHKEYRRWNYGSATSFWRLTMDTKQARGPFLFTGLSAQAPETVEHLDPKQYQKDGGEQVLLSLFDKRFPQRDDTDELTELLNEVFTWRAWEGEGLRPWISKATELFDRCERRWGVK